MSSPSKDLADDALMCKMREMMRSELDNFRAELREMYMTEFREMRADLESLAGRISELENRISQNFASTPTS